MKCRLFANVLIMLVLAACWNSSVAPSREISTAPQIIEPHGESTPKLSSPTSSVNPTKPESKRQIRYAHFQDEQHGYIVTSGQKQTSDGWHWADHMLFYTEDGGEHWTERSRLLMTDINSITFSNLEHGWIGATDGLYRTHDGGKTWTKMDVSGIMQVNRVQVFDPSHLFLSGYKDKTGLWGSAALQSDTFIRTENGGQSWEPILSPCEKTNDNWRQILHFSTISSGEMVCNGEPATAMSERSYFQSMDSGKTWSLVSKPKIESGHANDLFFFDVKRGWLATNRGGLSETTDGGKTWTWIHPPVDVEYATSPQFFSEQSGVAIFGGYGDAALYRTKDNGKTWTKIYPSESKEN
jgi:photosystem II stability/assembly factor-like uncharacterized protein